MNPTTNPEARPGLLTPHTTFLRLLCVGAIFLATSAGWFVLGGALVQRGSARHTQLEGAVTGGWGPPLTQAHPSATAAPVGGGPAAALLPESGGVRVGLAYEPKRKGLLWYRTYEVRFDAEYVFSNPGPVAQVIRVAFPLPAEGTTYQDIVFQVGDERPASAAPEAGRLIGTATVPPGAALTVKAGYRTRGLDRWAYTFPDPSRIRGFRLEMETDFREIDFPGGSPSGRERTARGWKLVWDYPDVIAVPPVAIGMPNVLNPGPVAARICLFAPVSLLFHFAVLTILGIVRRENLHPMHFFFLAAGCFAFQLLFAYLVDLVSVGFAFVFSTAVSLGLAGTYLHAVSGGRLTRVGVIAQLAYMVLFSLSFFFDGLTGITIALGAVATLGFLMVVTARIDWGSRFARREPAARTPAQHSAA